MNYEFFFLKRSPGHQPLVLRAMAPSLLKASAMIARHLGCTEADRCAIQKYLSRRGIRETQVHNVLRPENLD
ncbi:MAG TPA: hypothetical protein VFA68_10775 [Terriglobales bacterium]|nr:hypothetical protein [Terriglobales bacterium]